MTHLPKVLPSDVAVLGTKFLGQPVVGGHIQLLPQDSALLGPHLKPTQSHSQVCRGVGDVSVLNCSLVGAKSSDFP